MTEPIKKDFEKYIEYTAGQRTPEWYKLREEVITASNAKDYKKKTATGLKTTIDDLSVLRINPGIVDYTNILNIYSPTNIERGKVGEDYVFNFYAQLLAASEEGYTLAKSGLCISKEYPFLGASPDGVVFNKDGQPVGAIEIKCPTFKNHELAKQGRIPEDYKWQMVHQSIVLGVEWIHYLSFEPSQNNILDNLAIVRFKPTQEEKDEYLNKVKEAHEKALGQQEQMLKARADHAILTKEDLAELYKINEETLNDLKLKLQADYINYSGFGEDIEQRTGIEEETQSIKTPKQRLEEQQNILNEFLAANPERAKYSNKNLRRDALRFHYANLDIKSKEDLEEKLKEKGFGDVLSAYSDFL